MTKKAAMTRDAILALTGRELKWAIGKEFLGLRWYRVDTVAQLRKPSYRFYNRKELKSVLDIEGLVFTEVDEPDQSAFFDDSGNPDPTTDANACREMEREIERRGLGKTYVCELSALVDDGKDSSKAANLWRCKTAPLNICCHAALLAVQDAEENQ